MTSGAATEGVASLFFYVKPGNLFSRQFCGVTPVYFLLKTEDLFCSSLSLFLLISLGCHPPGGCHPHPFYLYDLVSPLFFVNCPQIVTNPVSAQKGGVGETEVVGNRATSTSLMLSPRGRRVRVTGTKVVPTQITDRRETNQATRQALKGEEKECQTQHKGVSLD